MDAFLQHFSNIFVLSPPARTFQDCIECLKQLNEILQTPYLTAFEFVDFNEIQPAFQKLNFPGVKALTKQQLEQLFKEFTDQKVKFDADYDFLYRQTIYILQYLYYIAKRICANIEEQQIPYLLHKAWIYRLKIDYECIKEQIDEQISLEEIVEQLSFLWFDQQTNDIDLFISRIDKLFKQTQSALIPIYEDGNLIQNLNHLLSQSQINPIGVPNDDSTIIGVENQLTLEQNIQIAYICQRNFSQRQRYQFYLNSLYALQQLGEQLYQLKDQPACITIKQLIAQLYISQINLQQVFDQKKTFSLLIFLLTGVTYLYNEQEFYLNLTKNLSAVNDLIQKIFVFPPAVDTQLQIEKNKKQKNKFMQLFEGCKVQHTIINADDVIMNIKRLSYVLSEFATDNRQYRMQTEFQIQDNDLNNLLSSLGGIQIVYMVVLRLYNQLQSLFINKRLLSVVEGLYLLTKSALYGGVQNNMIQYINSGLMGTKLSNIGDFLSIVGARIEVQTATTKLEYSELGVSQNDDNIQGKSKSIIPSINNIEEMVDSQNQIEI